MLNTEKMNKIKTLLDCINDIEPVLLNIPILIAKNKKSSEALEKSDVQITASSRWSEYKYGGRMFELDELLERSGISINPSMSAEEIEEVVLEWTDTMCDDPVSFYGYDCVEDGEGCAGIIGTTVEVEKTSNVVELEGCEYLAVSIEKYLRYSLLGS